MEQWKDIRGYEGYYMVSDAGNIRALPRTVVRADGQRLTIDAPVTPRVNRDGYVVVRLSKNGVRKQYNVHRLVAEAFIENPEQLPEVNHIDSNRSNNVVSNLEWCTHYDNVHYAIDAGRHVCTKDLRGPKNPNFGNSKMRQFWLDHPEKFPKDFVKHEAANVKAHPISMINRDGKELHFDWVGGCAAWLIQNGYTTATVNTIRTNIQMSIRKNTKYLGCKFYR